MKIILNVTNLIQNLPALFFNAQILGDVLNPSNSGVGKLQPTRQAWPRACLLLAHGHSHSWRRVYGASDPTVAQVSGHNRDRLTPKSLQCLLFDPLQHKTADPCSPQSFSLETEDTGSDFPEEFWKLICL